MNLCKLVVRAPPPGGNARMRARVLNTQQVPVTCVGNFLQSSEVKAFAKMSQNDRIFRRSCTIHFLKNRHKVLYPFIETQIYIWYLPNSLRLIPGIVRNIKDVNSWVCRAKLRDFRGV